MNAREKARRQDWYQRFEATVVRNRPDLAGRISWADAEYGCLTGKDPEAAALSYLSRHPRTENPS